jgi:hypothetical protein
MGKPSADELEKLDIWLAGLPLKERRPLSIEEEHEIRIVVNQARWAFWICVLLIAATPGLFMLKLLGLHARELHLLVLFVAFATVPALVVLVFSIRPLSLRLALKGGDVLVFQGPVRNLRSLDQSQNMLKSVKQLPEDGQWAEVVFLEKAHRIWSVNGGRFKEPRMTHSLEFARVAPVCSGEAPRTLTDLEKIELRKHVRKYQGPSNRGLATMGAAVACTAVLFLTLRHFGSIPHLAFLLVPVAAQVYLVKRGRPLASDLERDLENGQLVRDEWSGSLKLPISQMPWSRYGVPSAWRTAAPPASFFVIPKREDFVEV